MKIKIIYKKTQELKPYKNNPRKNDEAVKFVANSIKEFGFRIPITIDKSDQIVAGETRYKAAKLLKLEEVPCILADDLTEEQIIAFRLVDNKVSEKSEWDFELLENELKEISDINMEEFDFILNGDLEIDPYDEWKEMPEFNQEDNQGVQNIVIHFKERKDVEEFSKIIDQKITDKTKSIWFPEQKADKLKDIVYE